MGQLPWLRVLTAVTWFLVTMAMPQQNSLQTSDTFQYDLQMPGVMVEQDDAYWCKSFPAPEEESYISDFAALSDRKRAHHILVFGCHTPYRSTELDEAWQCGRICESGESILFAWAKNAEPTHLPADVGFKVGGSDSGVDYFVLQVHYKSAMSEGELADKSGIRLTITSAVPDYLAGIYLMAATVDENLPAHREKYNIHLSCPFEADTPIYPFAYRVHAHSLARVITGYVLSNGSFSLLGRGNPQWPQAFYPIHDLRAVSKGDSLFAVCSYNTSTRAKSTNIAMTHLDEMCNFYMMYYSHHKLGSREDSCNRDSLPQLTAQLPSDADVPPPPNPLLDDIASGNIQGINEVANWPITGLPLGQVTGLAVDSADHLHVFHRSSRVWDNESFDNKNLFLQKDHGAVKEPTILVLDQSDGHIVNKWGANLFYMPHGLHIDIHDNVWITDVALHQVMRFKKGEYKVQDLILGTAFVPGSDSSHFCKPSDVATLASGQFFVSDGYCNSRIIHYAADGKIIKILGEASSSTSGDGFPPPMTFDLPHSLSILEVLDMACVADRSNRRIQCFQLDGTFIRQMHAPDIPGRVFAVRFSPTGVLYAVNGEDVYKDDPPIQGFTFDPSKGQLIQTWAPTSQSFKQPHCIAVSRNGDAIFVGEIGPNKLWKFDVKVTEVAGVSLAVKKNSHPSSVNQETDADQSESSLEDGEAKSLGASLMIGGLLIIPVIIVVTVTICIRLRKSEVDSPDTKYSKVLQDDDPTDEEEEDIVYTSKAQVVRELDGDDDDDL